MQRCLVNARNRAESTEPSRFPPLRVEFCSVGPQRACRIFERAIMQPIVRDDPWHPIDQLCIHMLLLWRARSPPRHAARDRARVGTATGPSTFWRCTNQWVSLRAASWSYSLHIVWRWLANARTRAESLEKSRLSQFLLSETGRVQAPRA